MTCNEAQKLGQLTFRINSQMTSLSSEIQPLPFAIVKRDVGDVVKAQCDDFARVLDFICYDPLNNPQKTS